MPLRYAVLSRYAPSAAANATALSPRACFQLPTAWVSRPYEASAMLPATLMLVRSCRVLSGGMFVAACMANTGCWYCSARVSEIGLRGERIHVTSATACSVDTIAIHCYDYYGINLPYTYGVDQYSGKVTSHHDGTYSVNGHDVIVKFGRETVQLDNQSPYFVGQAYSAPHRAVWGYPMQLAQFIAIPLDIITGPFVIAYDAMTTRRQIGP